MSKLKLYKNNETGEEVACNLEDDRYSHVYYWEGCGATPKQITTDRFLSLYTPLPEAPEVGSTAWAVWMMEQGYSVQLRTHKKDTFVHLHLESDEFIYNDGRLFHMSNYTTWQLYEAPQPIVEKLPHEFVERQEVLVSIPEGTWIKKIFSHVKESTFFTIRAHDGKLSSWRYCLPYAGNEHLEGTVSDGEHGAVPAGYVPPHVPKLGDDDYWMIGDEVVDLATYEETVISSITTFLNCENGKFYSRDGMYSKGVYIRILFHKGSYVRKDGTVHEHVPTRAHRIDEDK